MSCSVCRTALVLTAKKSHMRSVLHSTFPGEEPSPGSGRATDSGGEGVRGRRGGGERGGEREGKRESVGGRVRGEGERARGPHGPGLTGRS
jgi:hypothetical protein